METWKAIPGYEGHYEASSLGLIRSLKYRNTRNVRVLARSRHPRGYLHVRLTMNGISRTCKVHRLVLLTFRGPGREGTEVSHLNGVRDDNRIENLEWATAKENSAMKRIHGTVVEGESHPRARLRSDDVAEIRFLWVCGNTTQASLAKKFRVPASTVSKIVRMKLWAHIATIYQVGLPDEAEETKGVA